MTPSTTLPILIIGASLSGVSLARTLLSRGIPCIVFDQNPPGRGNIHHGVNLWRWGYEPLLRQLGNAGSPSGEDGIEGWRERVAVDSEVCRRGNVDGAVLSAENGASRGRGRSNGSSILPNSLADDLFRAQKSKVLQSLSKGLNIQYHHKLVSFSPYQFSEIYGGRAFVSANFQILDPAVDVEGYTIEDGMVETEVQGSMIVGADGVFSAVRNHLSPSARASNFPLLMLAGSKRMPRSSFDRDIAPHMKTSTVIFASVPGPLPQVSPNKPGHRLSLSLNSLTPSTASLHWTYSFPPSHPSDLSFQTSRNIRDPASNDAKTIPAVLMAAVEDLVASEILVEPFNHVITADALTNDKLYNWVLRTLQLPRADLPSSLPSSSPESGKDVPVAIIGDAAHAMPIFLGDGANHALRDGWELGNAIGDVWLAYAGDGDVPVGTSGETLRAAVERFYDGVWGRWERGREEVDGRLRGFHGMDGEGEVVTKEAKSNI